MIVLVGVVAMGLAQVCLDADVATMRAAIERVCPCGPTVQPRAYRKCARRVLRETTGRPRACRVEIRKAIRGWAREARCAVPPPEPPPPPPIAREMDVTFDGAPETCGSYVRMNGAASTLSCGELMFGSRMQLTWPVATLRLGATCSANSSCTLSGSSRGGEGRDCGIAGCALGEPIPTVNPPLSTCTTLTFRQAASGTTTLADGALELVLPLAVTVHLAGDTATPCPVCEGASSPSSDCPPPAESALPTFDLTVPVTTGTVIRAAVDGRFCPAQEVLGCFGVDDCTKVVMQGTPLASMGAPSEPRSGVAVGAFCVPRPEGLGIDLDGADVPAIGVVSAKVGAHVP